MTLFAAPSVSAQETEAEASGDIVILATSDVHCGVDDNFTQAGLEQIRSTMEDNGDYTILVDDGDMIQGGVIGALTKGEKIIDLMNEMKYDVVIPGNHEFDYGMDRFMELVSKAEFPFISCNFRKEGELVFEPYLIKEVNGKKIGFVGVTTPRTIVTSTPVYFQDEDGNFIYDFMGKDKSGQEVYDAVQKAVDSAREEGADYVFVMAHLGNEEECEPWTYADLLSHTSGIDGLLDGHSHDTDQVTMQNKDGEEVFRMGLGTKLNSIGCIRISEEDGSISHDLYTWNNSVSMRKLTGITNYMSTILDEVANEMDEHMGRVFGKTPYDLVINDPEAKDETGTPIRIVRRAETNLGDLCADAYRVRTGADIALIGGGTIRKTIEKGDITYGELLECLPFGNYEAVVKVTGQNILDALEWGAHVTPAESGGFLQVSGLSYEIHTYIPDSCQTDEEGKFTGVDGEYRVKNVMVGDEPLDLEKTYTVAGTEYTILEFGDGFTSFKDGEIIQQGILLDVTVLEDFICENLGGTISEEYADPYGNGRIVAVDEAP